MSDRNEKNDSVDDGSVDDGSVDDGSGDVDPTGDGARRSVNPIGEASRVVRSFVESIPGPALVCDPRTLAIRAVNDPATALFDRDRGTLTLMGVTDLGEASRTPDGTSVADRLTSPGVDGDRTRFEWIVDADGGDRRRLEVTARLTRLNDEDLLVVGFTDVTDREHAERGRRLHRGLVDAIARTIPAALFYCDENGTLTRWNRRLEADSGYASEELSGRPLCDLAVDADDERVAEALARVYRSGETVSREITLLMRSGEHVPYQLTLGPVAGDDGAVIGAVGIGEDLTASSLREERLAVLTRVLRHNFRNDLNVISGFTERAIADVDDPETTSRLERVTATANRLLRAGETARKVERLLDEHHTPIPIPLSAAVAEAIDSLPDELLAEATVTVDVPASLTVSVVERFPEAVAELVDNAIRHNDSSAPTVAIRAATLPNESWASLVVADDGPGVPPAERAVLTGEETQLDHASGLGLWYVNWIVTAANGSFDISESKTGGTRIELSLRRTDPAETETDPVDEAE